MPLDVLVIGGGPAGSTAASLIKKYRPETTIRIVEASSFPRDHIGESQLPAVCLILDEMGAWEKVEACGFPIKVGARYRWGTTDELWDFNFLPNGLLALEPRPARYRGQRLQTAFQVDRSIYDKVLLDHCRDLSCAVAENTRATHVEVDQQRIIRVTATHQDSGSTEQIEAKYYVDASAGNLFRKSLDIAVDTPTSLKNIAIWDYWQNAEWAQEIGIGGTKAHILSLGWGWLWFIPITETRTSIGLVTSAEYYKSGGESIEELYVLGIASEPLISRLVEGAEREGKLTATRDWSYVAHRLCGANWFLAGDSCGFADPILSAGMTLAQQGARRVAYSILELLKEDCDPEWIRSSYERVQLQNIRNHIRFADYWYSANARFTDLKEYCSVIAADSGLHLDAEEAFQWLGTGGFTNDTVGLPGLATFRMGGIKGMMDKIGGHSSTWKINQFTALSGLQLTRIRISHPFTKTGRSGRSRRSDEVKRCCLFVSFISICGRPWKRNLK
jgi:flavin-dependent dehydrogenase